MNITLEPIAAMNAIVPLEMRRLNIVLVDIGDLERACRFWGIALFGVPTESARAGPAGDQRGE
jgi:hypothetical protein